MLRRAHLALAVALILALVPALIARVSAQSTPEAQRYGRDDQGYAGQFRDVLTELDTFWFGIFQASGVVYRTPIVVPLEQPVVTGCGSAGPEDFAFYCPPDEAIYYSPQGFADHELRIGDFAPIVVTAHEWGHHVQWLTQMQRLRLRCSSARG